MATVIKFQLPATVATSNQKTLLELNVQELVGNTDVRVQVLGIVSPKADWNQTSASWTSLSNATNGIKMLTPLTSGMRIDSVNKNFINWPSLSGITVVGHVTVKAGAKNQSKLVDVSDYLKNVISIGGSSLTFLLYRPYLHPAYSTSAGIIPGDDLSGGAKIRFYSVNSAFPPQLVQYKAK